MEQSSFGKNLYLSVQYNAGNDVELISVLEIIGFYQGHTSILMIMGFFVRSGLERECSATIIVVMNNSRLFIWGSDQKAQ